MNSLTTLNVITIQKGYNIPSLQRCTNCCQRPKYHCPFCLPSIFQPTTLARVRSHLMSHTRRAVFLGGYAIHRCGLECRTGTHYHCPLCRTTRIRKIDFLSHLWRDHRQTVTSTPTVDTTKEETDQTKGLQTPGEEVMESGDNGDIDADKETIMSDSEDKKSHGASSGSGSQLQKVPEKQRDHDVQYFMNLVKLFKELPPRKKADVRLKIERLLLEAEFL